MDERIQKYEEKMKKTLASLESELVTIRAGRANPHILDKLAVDDYGVSNLKNHIRPDETLFVVDFAYSALYA